MRPHAKRKGWTLARKVIYFIEGRNRDAMGAWLELKCRRIVKYGWLARMERMFGVAGATASERKAVCGGLAAGLGRFVRGGEKGHGETVLGISQAEDEAISKKPKRRITGFHGVQSQITDFIGRFLLV